MSGFLAVFLKITMILGVILMGWVARRRRAVSAEFTRDLSRFIIDYAMPAMIFTHMLRTVGREMLFASWYFPILGVAVVGFGLILGWAAGGVVESGPTRRAFILSAGMTNWFYFPLVMVEALLSGPKADTAVATILLFNLGIMPFVWSVGVGIVRGKREKGASVMAHLLVPGFVATVLGMLIPVLWPSTRAWMLAAPESMSPVLVPVDVLLQSMTMLGKAALPMSLVMIGSQLGGLHLASIRPDPGTLVAVGIRLLAVPAAAYIALTMGQGIWWRLPDGLLYVTVLVAAMPVAVNCPLLCERYGGDADFAARTVLHSTLLSVLTVPAVLYATGLV